MRVVYKIVLGLLLFNAFLTLFAPVFNEATTTSIDKGAVNYSSTDMTNYTITNSTNVMNLIFGNKDNYVNDATWGAMIGISSVVFITALFMKNYVVIGVGLFVAVIVGLYIRMSAVIASMGSQTNNIYVTGIITIVGIAIGLIVVFDVIDMFAPAPAR